MRNRPELETHRLRQLRESHGLKPHELAVKLGCDPSTIYYWERTGRVPDWAKLALADLYEVTAGFLMGWDENGSGEREAAA